MRQNQLILVNRNISLRFVIISNVFQIMSLTHYCAEISEIPFDEPKPTEGEQVIVVDPSPLLATTPSQQGVLKYEILKSLVYGGLIELITSLGVVTSAASADATTCKYLATLSLSLCEIAQYIY